MHEKNEPNQNLYTRLNLFLDNELPREAEKELMQELNANPSYRQYLETERSFRRLIKNKIQRRKASPDLIRSLKEKLTEHKPGSPDG